MVSDHYIRNLLPFKGLNLSWQLPAPHVAMAKFTISVGTPCVDSALTVNGCCQRELLEFANFTCFELHLVHVELLRSLKLSKLTCSPNKQFVLSGQRTREPSSNNFSDIKMAQSQNLNGVIDEWGESLLLRAESQLHVLVLSTSVHFALCIQE